MANTFGAIADEWLDKQRAKLAEVTATKAVWLLGMVSALNNRPIAEIEAPDVLAVLRSIEASGHHETARRVKQRIGQVFRYAAGVTSRGDLARTSTAHRIGPLRFSESAH